MPILNRSKTERNMDACYHTESIKISYERKYFCEIRHSSLDNKILKRL